MPPHSHFEDFPDEDLLRNMAQGCTECFALLFHRYFRQVFSVAFRILRDKAETEDVLQEVFLAIYLQQERFDSSKGSVRTWVLQFAYFKALLRRRYLNIRNFYSQEELSEIRETRSAGASDLMGMSATEWTRYVETGIAALTAKQRQVIVLVHFDGYTLREVSEKLRESLATTRNTYYRGLKELRGFLLPRTAVKGVEKRVAFEGPLEGNDPYRLES